MIKMHIFCPWSIIKMYVWSLLYYNKGVCIVPYYNITVLIKIVKYG